MKALEQYFPEVLFIILYKPAAEYVDKILNWDLSASFSEELFIIMLEGKCFSF